MINYDQILICVVAGGGGGGRGGGLDTKLVQSTAEVNL